MERLIPKLLLCLVLSPIYPYDSKDKTYQLHSLFQSLKLFYIILGWDRKDIDRTELFVIFNNSGITENGIGAIFHLLFCL